MGGEHWLRRDAGQRGDSCPGWYRVGLRGILSCYSECHTIQNSWIVYLWNFLFNIFGLQLTMGNWTLERVRGMTVLENHGKCKMQNALSGALSGRHCRSPGFWKSGTEHSVSSHRSLQDLGLRSFSSHHDWRAVSSDAIRHICIPTKLTAMSMEMIMLVKQTLKPVWFSSETWQNARLPGTPARAQSQPDCSLMTS